MALFFLALLCSLIGLSWRHESFFLSLMGISGLLTCQALLVPSPVPISTTSASLLLVSSSSLSSSLSEATSFRQTENKELQISVKCRK